MPAPVQVGFILSFECRDHLFTFRIELFDCQKNFFDLVVKHGIGFDQQVVTQAFAHRDQCHDHGNEYDKRIPNGQSKSQGPGEIDEAMPGPDHGSPPLFCNHDPFVVREFVTVFPAKDSMKVHGR